ncbi:hypothetical protein LTR36_009240 [Oleoguttula mirabilis]|uniref:RNA helicase n=1 Tax=Oleoguttula mirabilis TaxID=1507867 RepID=A0AAV9J689_9PEZI|nr:hypothetical protein LTR36_009240 [Oleoguttula mirabilis]
MSVDDSAQVARLDVYARPFIPYSLKAVNEAPVSVLPSMPVRWIDFPAYVNSFAGTSLLLADPPPADLSGQQGPSPTTNAALSPDGTSPIAAEESQELRATGYHMHFQHALIQEAGALQQECEDHALYKVPLGKAYRDPRPDMYSLQVPGLRELSLRIEIGDIVQLRPLHFDAWGEILRIPHIFRHDAVVWSIDRLRETLTLCVYGLLPRSMLFNACFSVQAGRLGALYRSVLGIQKALQGGDASWTRSMLFPEEADGSLQRTLNRFQVRVELEDPLLNYEQIRAVDTVLTNDFGRVPYLISGPPGTGKTKTLVELALQLVSKQKASHLLVCAPSDPAADTLVQRLSKHLRPSQLLRLTAPSRSFPEVPDSVLPFCYVDGDMFFLPPLAQMMRYTIVVTTCRDAELMLRGRLSNADLYSLEKGVLSMLHPEEPAPRPALHWTGLLVDEAAQATEPEALIPLSVIAPPQGYESNEQPLPLFVMAGDQNQLGPRTASRTAAMQTSLFERLLERPLYRLHPLARSKQSGGVMRPLRESMLPILRPPFANLIRNYRSHPAIIATPSSLFYNDTLEPEASSITSLLPWQGWKGSRWPVLFACNTGPDEIEQDGGGWYNNTEAKMACQYAFSFLQLGLVQAGEICIMSPFSAQVRVLRKLARHPSYNMSAVSIGPLEAFQGLESKLVILCTTRTRDRFIEQDVARGLGVIHEPRRFNVALTRAKEGLIVIGNPSVLENDKHWAAFLSFCHRNGLWEDEAGKKWEMAASNAAVVSKMERQLVYQMESEADRAQDAVIGMRRLGLGRDEDEDIWQSGMAAEAVVQDEDGIEYEDGIGHEDVPSS